MWCCGGTLLYLRGLDGWVAGEQWCPVALADVHSRLLHLHVGVRCGAGAGGPEAAVRGSGREPRRCAWVGGALLLGVHAWGVWGVWGGGGGWGWGWGWGWGLGWGWLCKAVSGTLAPSPRLPAESLQWVCATISPRHRHGSCEGAASVFMLCGVHWSRGGCAGGGRHRLPRPGRGHPL